jgi:hypothetical protein
MGCTALIRGALRGINPLTTSETHKRLVTFITRRFALVGEGGFEPPKSVTTDLQSAPFGRSGIPPYIQLFNSISSPASGEGRAGGRIRTPDLLITNQLLYRLSYTSKSLTLNDNSKTDSFCQ